LAVRCHHRRLLALLFAFERLSDVPLVCVCVHTSGREKKRYRPVMAQLFLGIGSNDPDETTGSAWHCARHGNLFIQVVGTKAWSFMDPQYSLLTAPHLRHHVVAAAAGFAGGQHMHRWPTAVRFTACG
jgi:hypothetical protein